MSGRGLIGSHSYSYYYMIDWYLDGGTGSYIVLFALLASIGVIGALTGVSLIAWLILSAIAALVIYAVLTRLKDRATGRR